MAALAAFLHAFAPERDILHRPLSVMDGDGNVKAGVVVAELTCPLLQVEGAREVALRETLRGLFAAALDLLGPA